MNITKKIVNELITLIKTNGYWSDPVLKFLSKFDYNQVQKIQNKASLQLGISVNKL